MIFAGSIPFLLDGGNGMAHEVTVEKLFIPGSRPQPVTMPASTSEIETSRSHMSFLDLPPEIRLEIYQYLLVVPNVPRSRLPASRCSVSVPILSANRQIHAEASRVLYSYNKFFAHPSLLTAFPRLRTWLPPVREARVYPRIRRFHLRLRLDCDPQFEKEAAARAFSGLDELTVEVYQAMVRFPSAIARKPTADRGHVFCCSSFSVRDIAR
jgi:hypothetical protein